MRLALIGDIHMFRLFVAPWYLLGKAAVGHANLWLNRRHVFDLRLLPAIFARVEAIRPDLLVFSGDYTTVALPSEFATLAGLLQPLLARFPAVGVPGNHDRYSFTSTWLRRLERFFPGLVPPRFPLLRELTPRWRLLALDSAVPRLFSARGRLGPRQLAEAAEAMRAAGDGEGLVILSHYALGTPPFLPPMNWGHRLADADALLADMRHCRARLIYMHGHVHFPWRWRREDDGLRHVTDLNAGAPCLIGPDFPAGQGFWEIHLPDDPADPIETIHHYPIEHPPAAGQAEARWSAEHVL